MTSRLRSLVLNISGVLLVILGLLHLAVTPLIARLVRHAVSVPAGEWLVPPMLLNHVVVGLLLLPLGILTTYAASDAASGVRWAIVTVRTTALSVAALPVTLFALLGTRYFEAVPFVVATSIVCVATLALLLAAFWPPSRGKNAAD